MGQWGQFDLIYMINPFIRIVLIETELSLILSLKYNNDKIKTPIIQIWIVPALSLFLLLLLLLVILLNLPLVEHFYKAVFICGMINDCQSLITRDRLSSPQRQRAPPPLRPQITPDTTSDDSSSSSFVFECEIALVSTIASPVVSRLGTSLITNFNS